MPKSYENLIESTRDFIKSQRVKAGLLPEFRLNGYTILELETRFERIPCKDWFKILRQISTDEDFFDWYLDFCSRLGSIKKQL